MSFRVEFGLVCSNHPQIQKSSALPRAGCFHMLLIFQSWFLFLVLLLVAGDFSSDQVLQKGHQVQRAFFKDTHALPLVPNPLVCLEAGDTILFQLSIGFHSEYCFGLCAHCGYISVQSSDCTCGSAACTSTSLHLPDCLAFRGFLIVSLGSASD